MARGGDLISGLLMGLTGFMEGKLIKRERERQAKIVADRMRIEEEQRQFLNRLRMADEERAKAAEGRAAELQPFKVQEATAEARKSDIEAKIRELELTNAPAAEAAKLRYQAALAKQAEAGAAENAAQAEKARRETEGLLSEAEEIILKSEVETAQKQILGTGTAGGDGGGGGYKDVSNAVADEARARLEAYKNAGLERRASTKTKQFSTYLKANPAAQDSLLNAQIASMRGAGQSQAPVSGPVAGPGEETEAIREGNALIERLAKARNNPSAREYQAAQDYFSDPETGYQKIMAAMAKKYSTQRSPYAVRPNQDNSSVFDAIRKRY